MDAFAIYRDRRILTVALLGFSSGLPLLLTAGTLSTWLTQLEINIKTVGYFALVGSPYVFKFVWAPLVNHLHLPILTRLLGRRRSWILLTQILLMITLLLLGASDPTQNLAFTAVLAVIVAFCSASQDIVVDAYRIEILDKSIQGPGAAALLCGYRIGLLVAGAGALYIAYFSQSWFATYAVMASLMGVGVIAVLFGSEPTLSDDTPSTPGVSGWLRHAVVEPFTDLIRRQGIMLLAVLAFVFLYKLGDAFAGSLANPFYIKMGFSTLEIANVSKVFGLLATLLGTFFGGIIVARIGLIKSLVFCGVLQMVSNLLFAWLATVGHSVPALVVTIAGENLATGMGSSAFVAYISALCGRGYTGTQYALLSSLTGVGRTGLAALAGDVVASAGWVNFFLLSTVMALPGLLLLVILRHRLLPEAQEAASAEQKVASTAGTG